MRKAGATVLFLLCSVLSACQIGAASGSLASRPNEGEAGSCAPCQFLGGDGLCLNRDLPPVASALADPEQGPALEAGASVCGVANEVCIPCVNPLTGANTGACELGPAACGNGGGSCESPAQVIDPAMFPACEVGGRCVGKSLIDSQSPGSSAKLPACSGVADGVCVPEDAVRYGGNYKPPVCSIGGPAGLEGRCLPEFVVPAAQKDKLATLPNDVVCSKSDQLCVPCYDPLTLEETGACSSTRCDAPVRDQKGFATCVDNRGKCIPESIITTRDPNANTENLDPRDCQGGNLCVPNRLAAQPATYQGCTTTLGGEGTCLDVTVLNVPLSGVFGKGGCPAVDKCVPCQTLGTATNAPGCAEMSGL